MTFDDYLQWDFDPKQQLPDYYLLLGCGGHEDDPLALQAAVEALLSDLRKLARTLRQQDYEAYERITRNILYAQKVLTNPGLKQQYDARLLKQQRSRSGAEGGGVLVGINFHEHQEWQAITAMQFVFLQPDGTETTTPMYGEAKTAQATVVRAPEGLAIKALEVKEGVRAFRLGFGPLVPLRGESPDRSVTDSDWYGPGAAWRTSRRIELPSGALPIGVEGSYGVRIGRFRLLGPTDSHGLSGSAKEADSPVSPAQDQAAPSQDVSSVNPLIWARIRAAVDRNELVYSDWGYRARQEPKEFRFIPESGGVLVGINFHQNSEWHAVTAMQFVFLRSDGNEAVSPMYGDAQSGDLVKVRAPEGLAINQLLLQQGDHEASNEIRAFRVEFAPIRVPGVAFRSAATEQSPMHGPGGPGKPVLLNLPGDCSVIGVEGRYSTVIGRMRVIGVGTK